MHNDNLARGYSDGDTDTNRTPTASLMDLVEQRYSRRETVMGGVKAGVAAFFGTTLLAACDNPFASSDSGGAFVVDAGSSSVTSSGRLVTLSGNQQSGTASSMLWTQVSGPAVQLTGANSGTATFIAPAVATGTPLEFRFEATGTNGQAGSHGTVVTVNPAQLGFASLAKNKNDVVSVPAGYSVTVMTRLGDPLAAAAPAYANDGTDTPISPSASAITAMRFTGTG